MAHRGFVLCMLLLMLHVLHCGNAYLLLPHLHFDDTRDVCCCCCYYYNFHFLLLNWPFSGN